MCINCSQNNNIFQNDQDGLNGLYGGYSSAWLFDASALSGSPSTSYFRMNNATLSSVTSIIINKTNKDNIDLSAFISSFNNNSNFGYLRLFKEFDSTTFVDFKITAISVSGNIYTLTVIYISGNNTFLSNDSTVFSFTPNGNINPPGLVFLGKLIGFDMNSTSDQLITLNGGNKFVIIDIVITNASTSLTTAGSFQINSGVGRTGTTYGEGFINLGTDSLSYLVTPDNFINNLSYSNSSNNPHIAMNKDHKISGNTIYSSLGTPQGATSTADIYIYGYILS